MQLEIELYFSPLDSCIGCNEVNDSVPALSDWDGGIVIYGQVTVWRESSCGLFPGICLEGQRKTMENLRAAGALSWYSDWGFID